MKNNQIQFRAEFIIENGKIEEYKKLIQEMSRVVEGSGTKCVVYEVYTNSEAVFVHIAGLALQTIPRRFSVSLG